MRHRIRIFRLRCRSCSLTVTLLPDFLLPFTRYVVAVVMESVGAYVDGAGSYRAVAVAITGIVLPADLAVSNLTDALEVLRPKPGYQRIYSWVTQVAATATADVQLAAAWATTRVPTSTVVDYQTVPFTPPQAGRTQDAVKRTGLDSARMLVRIFTAVRELNPTGTGWLVAWQRFVVVIIRRTPWRGPPRSPPEPRSS